jgi:hypothetical protein
METYVSNKEVMAKAMTRLQYNDYRGWKLNSDENGSDEGMLVEYINGSDSNHPNHKGYISWSPLSVFEESHKLNGNLSLSDAVEFGLKRGKAIRRREWRTFKFVFMQVPSNINIEKIVPKMQSLPEEIKEIFLDRSKNKISRNNSEINYHNQLALVYPDNKVTAWNASTDDILTNDYEIL